MRPLRQGMEHYMAILDDKYKESVEDMDFDITMDLAVQVRKNIIGKRIFK